MCHGFDLRDRREFEREESEDEEPSFVNEEASVETEVLTDGGDEEQEAPDE
ncbi:hypothetical protein [Natronomonas marina]|jgi:hypothetical protein|uniref:hypothetical protein n=1 Tax=Natronomonas marina TaxID=2961939 RepID=UPI0020C9EA35|nr:hypothetical protein [Natronomonas marina]